jgi:hypothetical protein
MDAAAAMDAAGASTPATAERLNVLVLFIDSLGRRHFFRRMPRSAAALEGVASAGHASLYQFFRYHVTGFNTQPNSARRRVFRLASPAVTPH